ncbi:hypothetical protein OS493_028216 [Desmophyllum pertusum]|uniref:Cell death regulator Aven n=1 Tax=Desmophyllum pertusum TaxID=174260 RepID=A0A9X0CR04_9CNID|nr:hypothetical protein OS493_028216 [Desmophyllum pertusum]
MRPDEHKKKHRTEYKKKHGISNKKTTSKEKHETTKDADPSETQEKGASADTDEGDHKQFSRRNVSSNWDRYGDFEDISDEEDSTTDILKRGEDFNVLLERSENPASEFRFQSEKDWDQEDDSSTTQNTSSALEIDFGTLAASLNCVPLHKRLDISADGIHPDVLKEFELNADLHLKDQCILPWSSNNKTVNKPAVTTMTASSSTATTTTTTTESRPSIENTCQHSRLPRSTNHEQDLIQRTLEQSGNDSKQLAHSLTGNDVDLLHVKQPGCTSEPCTLRNTENLQNSLKDVLKTVSTTSKTGIAGQEARSGNNEDDDELEFLLSIGTPGSNGNGKSTSGHQSNKVTSSMTVPSSSVNPTVQSAKNADDDLEDWLDSVLG